LSGVVIGEPRQSQLPSGTQVVTFMLRVRESFLDREGNECERDSFFVIENLGKSSEKALFLAKDGQRIVIDGYVRSESKKVRIRTYTLYLDRSLESLSYKEGIRKALDIIKESRNIITATQTLEQLLEDQ
jgi:hypothetical protein